MAGFDKEVVIKRLRAELADDPRIVEMFLDEARIGALLNHPNIVHVYDVDEHDGIPYIAMEYIIGEELNELCRRGIAHDRFLPLEHAVELIRQAAAGMGYFHAKRSIVTSGTGAEIAGDTLDIVHCDISPTNLLVTQDGFLKVIDFGIAKARGQRQQHDGVLPGKLSYMSPEQAARQPLDHRSDIFSLGIVLYEITVGKRLFRGQAQDVVKRLVDTEIEPPTYARRKFPPALESIVMRALEKHPGDRYQSAYDLADDLETFLRDGRLHSGPVRIARYLDMLALAAGGQRRPELVSEAEQRRSDHDEIDFDSQVFDSYAPSEGSPGPDQAPLWDDTDEPEADVARALGMELAELRLLRTPVPTRPTGVGDDLDPITNPVERVKRGDAEPTMIEATAKPVGDELDDGWQIDVAEPEPSAAPKPVEQDLTERAETPVPPVPPPAIQPARGFSEIAAAVRAHTAPPAIGAAYLARSNSPRIAWILVGFLGMVLVSLIVYLAIR
jgi:serine/threonine protein kinase